MEIYMIFSTLGLLLITGGWFAIVVKAFQVNIRHGLAVIMLPPYYFVFAFAHWQKVKRPFFVNTLGGALFMFSALLQSIT